MNALAHTHSRRKKCMYVVKEDDLWRAQTETHTSESSTGDRCLDRCSMPRRADCDQLTADESSFGEKSRPPRNRSCQEERRG
jgi:hypothetical protein